MSSATSDPGLDAGPGARDDALLSPTLQDYVPRSQDGSKPWRLGSQVYVAFFGGVLAVTAIALINARRLRVPRRGMLAIAGAGAAGLVGVVAFAALFIGAGDPPRGARVATQLIAIASWGLMFLVQRPWDRLHAAFSEEDEDEAYESLVGPGLVAVFTLGLAQLAFVFGAGE